MKLLYISTHTLNIVLHNWFISETDLAKLFVVPYEFT